MPIRTKGEISLKLATDPYYLEDFSFITDTLDDNEVFIGQFDTMGNGSIEGEWLVTVGMFQSPLPEVVFSGVPLGLAQYVMNELRSDPVNAIDFLAGKRTKRIFDLEVMAIPVDTVDQHPELALCQDIYTYRGLGSFLLSQVVFADEAGNYPWGAGYSAEDRERQPLLGMPHSQLI